jgi:hypothetical protein
MIKSNMIGVWVTPEMKEKIEIRAKDKGMSPPEYIRTLIDRDLEKGQ